MSDLKDMFKTNDNKPGVFRARGSGNSTTKKGFNYSLLYKVPLSLIGVILIGMYVLSGFYIVQPKEVGVVTRFGKFLNMTDPGLHYRLPFPFEGVQIVNVTDMRRVELGYRTVKQSSEAKYESRPAEALMLTGDLSIVMVEATVLYKIKNAADFIFKVQNPENAVKMGAEAALRQIVGHIKLDDILTTQKMTIQLLARENLQKILDLYGTGIIIEAVLLQDVGVPEAVQDSYRDVASAKEDKQKKINEAEAYRNQIIPQARGEAVKIINEAEAYKATRIAQAKGDVARFEEMLIHYRQGKDVTRTRLYLETMEKILPRLNKIIVSDGNQGVLKLLNLGQEKGGEN